MTSADTINHWLDGSPYLFPSDLDGEERASTLLEEQLQIKDRQSRVQASFAEQAAELRAEVDRDFDLRLVFESNAIEGAKGLARPLRRRGPSLRLLIRSFCPTTRSVGAWLLIRSCSR